MEQLKNRIRRAFGLEVRGFKFVREGHRKCGHFMRGGSPQAPFRKLPERSTLQAAGYDIFSPIDVVIPPGKKVAIDTDVTVYMRPDEVFKLYPRSNQGITYDIMLANTTGVIDADYHDNPTNGGNFSVVLRNIGTEPYQVVAGQRIAQGTFEPYLVADGEDRSKMRKRTGGVGSTGK